MMRRPKVWRAAICLLLLAGGGVLALCLLARGKTAGGVEGLALDTAGRPVADARVFNRGDARELIETRTDAAGRFSLRGFEPGAVYVFAQKDGYRFTGLRTQCGTSEVRLTMRRADEPPPKWAPQSAPMPIEEQQKLAHRLLEKLWAAKPSDGHCDSALINVMSRIDPELALRWSSGMHGVYADICRAAMAEKVADEDLDEAMALMAQSGGAGMILLDKLARKYAATDPAKAMRCAEEYIVRVRAMDEPWTRALCLSQAGVVVMQLGKKDAGRALSDEVIGMMEQLRSKLPLERAYVAATIYGTVAIALAETDLSRAAGLLERIPAEHGLDGVRGHVAVAACVNDLDRALAIVAKIQAPANADCARLCIAYRLAATRPADAVRVAELTGLSAEGCVGQGRHVRATVLGRLAEAIALHNRALACSLIDRAFDVLLETNGQNGRFEQPAELPATAAFLAVQAHEIGYPDMESLIYRVLACRPDRSHASPEDIARMAALLALVDPQAAEEMFQSVKSQDDKATRTTLPVGRLLIDAKRGELLFDEALSPIKGKADADSQLLDLIEAASVLALPIGEKPQHIAPYPAFLYPDYRRADQD